MRIDNGQLTFHSDARIRGLSAEEDQVRCSNHEYMAMLSMHTIEVTLRSPDCELRPRVCAEFTGLRDDGEWSWRGTVPAADEHATADGHIAEKRVAAICATGRIQ